MKTPTIRLSKLPGYHPVRYGLELARARMGTALGAPPPVRVLLVSDGISYTSEQQFAPLLAQRGELRRKLGLIINKLCLNDVLKRPHLTRNYDAVFLKLSFKKAEAEALAAVGQLAKDRGRARLVYFDGDDDSCVQWGEILRSVDLYVKKHMFADRSTYRRRFVGKNNLTDYVARCHGISFDGNPIKHSGTVAPELADKIVLGWNIAMDEKLVTLYHQSRSWEAVPREHDVICRTSSARTDWIYPLRGPVFDALAPLKADHRILLPGQRVPLEQYLLEMRSSRICVSPFGYGEICWRDFEAVICGCLLVKPDMSHLRTEPDIFVPGETYVPVKWDFSDLADVCRRYLNDPESVQRIARRALAVLADYYDGLGVVEATRRLLAHPNVGCVRAAGK
jgi:hypothetical protein